MTTSEGFSIRVVLRVFRRCAAEAVRHALDPEWSRRDPHPVCLHCQRTLRGLPGMAHGVTAPCGRLTAIWPATAQKSATDGTSSLIRFKPLARKQRTPATQSCPPYADPNCPQTPWPASLTHFRLPRSLEIRMMSYTPENAAS